MSHRAERRGGGTKESRFRREMGSAPRAVEGRDTGTRGYWVQIIYTEPEFQLRNPHCPGEFRTRLKYEGTGSSREALDWALNYFDFCQQNSHVAWARIIKSVTIERA